MEDTHHGSPEMRVQPLTLSEPGRVLAHHSSWNHDNRLRLGCSFPPQFMWPGGQKVLKFPGYQLYHLSVSSCVVSSCGSQGGMIEWAYCFVRLVVETTTAGAHEYFDEGFLQWEHLRWWLCVSRTKNRDKNLHVTSYWCFPLYSRSRNTTVKSCQL